MPTPAPEPSNEYIPPPPSISLRDKEIKKYLGKMPAYDEMITINAKFRVKEVSDGENYDGEAEQRVVLELSAAKDNKNEKSKDEVEMPEDDEV